MRDAQQRVESARARADAVQRAAGELPSRDGDYAYRQALREETMALREYRRVLHIFSGLVLEGKIPHEDEGLRRDDESGDDEGDVPSVAF